MYTFLYSAFRPDMMSLDKLSTLFGDINIIQESAGKYKEIGTILLDDKTGAKVNNITIASRGIPEEAIRAIYTRWMREDSNYSWVKLTSCFKCCGLNTLASEIEFHFLL